MFDFLFRFRRGQFPLFDEADAIDIGPFGLLGGLCCKIFPELFSLLETDCALEGTSARVTPVLLVRMFDLSLEHESAVLHRPAVVACAVAIETGFGVVFA